MNIVARDRVILFLLTFSDALKTAGSFALNPKHIKMR